MRRAMLAVFGAAALGAAAVPAEKARAADNIYCHDARRDLVEIRPRGDCDGDALDAARGAALERDIRQKRLDAMRRTLVREERERASGLSFSSAGTGFVVSAQGHILTSAHVVAGCAAVLARPPGGGDPAPFEVLKIDAARDLALGRMARGAGEPVAAFAPTDAPNGDPVAVVGYPQEGMIPLEPRLTAAHVAYDVSNPAREDATGLRGDIRRGHSGGPVLDSMGRVAGVLKAKVDSVAAWRQNGQLLKDMGVMVKRADLLDFLRSAGVAPLMASGAGEELTGAGLGRKAFGYVTRLDCQKEGPKTTASSARVKFGRATMPAPIEEAPLQPRIPASAE